MDPFAAVLEGPRARGAFLLRTVLAPPWAIRVEDQAPLTVISVVRGHACLVDEQVITMRPGDLALIRGPLPYTFADAPDSVPTIRIDPDQRCWSLVDGRNLALEMGRGVRTWGNAIPENPDATVALVGAYDLTSELTPILLAALPRFVVIHAETWSSAVRDLLTGEIDRDEPGQQVILDRLLDLVLIDALRHWCTRTDLQQTIWWLTPQDDALSPALQAIQADPAAQWTVERLARLTGLSRAAFARRFHEKVGSPPMTFITELRLSMAADLLRDTDVTLSSVAKQVGYGTPFALSAAFSRRYSISPSGFRRRARERTAETVPIARR